MTDMEAIKQAEQFLSDQRIGFVSSGMIGRATGEKLEVIFPVPETLDPRVAVVDPADVRVWVNVKTGMVELIQQL
jgi:hypothetical protein